MNDEKLGASETNIPRPENNGSLPPKEDFAPLAPSQPSARRQAFDRAQQITRARAAVIVPGDDLSASLARLNKMSLDRIAQIASGKIGVIRDVAPQVWFQPVPSQDGYPPLPDTCGDLLWVAEGPVEFRGVGGVVRETWIRIERYERCFKWIFTKVDKQPSIVLFRDLWEPVDEYVVEAFDAPSEGFEIIQGRKWWGEFKNITVSGCVSPLFFQFIRESEWEKMPGMPGTKRTVVRKERQGPDGWSPDGRLPYSYTSAKKLKPSPQEDVFIDGPGDYFVGLGAKPGAPIGFSMFQQSEFKTYICCKGRILGMVNWGYTREMRVEQGRSIVIRVVPQALRFLRTRGDAGELGDIDNWDRSQELCAMAHKNK